MVTEIVEWETEREAGILIFGGCPPCQGPGIELGTLRILDKHTTTEPHLQPSLPCVYVYVCLHTCLLTCTH